MKAALHAVIRAAFLVCLLAAPAVAQSTKPPASVEQLIRLLDEPEVRAWLEQAKSAPSPAPAEPPASVQAAERLNAVRDHLRDVAAAFRVLPQEIGRAVALLRQELNERGFANVLLLLAAFAALGYGSEQAFWHATARTRAWIGARHSATVPERLRLIGLRLGFGLALVAIFGIGSIGAFLLFDWPPLLHRIVVGYLVAVLAIRLALIVGRVFLEPGGRGLDRPEQYRVIPMSTAAARFWYRRLGLFVGYLALGLATLSLLDVLGFPAIHRSAAGYVLALGLLAIAFEALWRRPLAEPAAGRRLVGRTALNILLTAYGVLLWLLRVAGLDDLFWLAVVAFLLPAAIRIGDAAVSHLLRPSETGEEPRRGILEVCIERGLRTFLIIAAALWLANVWGIDLIELTSRDTLGTRLVRGALSGIVTLLIADFIWQVAKAAVDAKLAETAGPVEHGSDASVRNARTRTLLPIFRNILFAVIAVIAGLTALSALGVDIGPLIAGAGVLGVAVGFGAQTLVKDIISGIFYLLDDAFRVGEYIQSGSYKGTVESFSLRSVKLRHHRGPVYTVPFGELGAVQNMSRDWVIDKFQIGVTYATDLERARKIIKKIGADLAADPELGKHIIEPLKMQGVEQFGDYAIQIRCKMTTRPGEQFVIRRKAFARIKQAFDEAGIDFAFPTVQVAGSDDKAIAAARQVLDAPKAPGAGAA